MPRGFQPTVVSLALALRSAQVPCVLWGECLLCLHGVPVGLNAIEFVIPDDCLEAGARVLSQCKGFVPCPDPRSCWASSETRPYRPLAAHVHLESNPEVAAGVYVQSDTLWFLPPIDHSLLSATEHTLPPYFALASDQAVFPPYRIGRGHGVITDAGNAVVAPRSHILLEAFMRMLARDTAKGVSNNDIANIAYMQLYVDSDGFLDADLLPEPLRTTYRELNKRKATTRQWMQELIKVLGLAEEGPADSVGD